MSTNVNPSNINKLNTSINGSNQPQAAQTVQTQQQIFENNKKPLEELAKRLNITVEQLETILATDPDFLSKTPETQASIIAGTTPSTPVENQAQNEVKVEKAEQTPAATSEEPLIDNSKKPFNKAEFGTLSDEQKKEVIGLEIAKNIYTYGVTGKNGQVYAEAHPDKPWDELTDEEQAAYLENFKSLVKSDEKMQTLIKDIETKFDENFTEHDKKLAAKNINNTIINTIQAANNEGMSVVDFLKLESGKRNDAIVKYLDENQATQTEEDKNYLKFINSRKENVKAYMKKYAIKSVKGDISCEQIEKDLRYNNITQQDLELFRLEEKQKRGDKLNEREQKRLDILKTDSSKSLNIEQKARNYRELKSEFDKLAAKKSAGKLTKEEKETFKLLKRTLNTKESKELAKIEPYEPKTMAEKYADTRMKEINEKLSSLDPNDETTMLLKLNAVKKEIAGLPENERQEFLRNAMKSDPAFGSKWIGHLSKDYPGLVEDPELIRQASLDVANMSPEVLKNYHENVIRSRKNPKYAANVVCAARTEGQIWSSPQYNKKPEFDASKTSYGDMVAQLSDVDANKLGIDVANTISDAKMQADVYDKIQHGEATKDPKANDEIQCHAVRSAVGAHEDNQGKIVAAGTDMSAAATELVATEDIISQLDDSAQTEAFTATHSAIDKHFEGEEAINYSNSLADQIQNCAKENQLDMHNNMMGSKYKEVQEHAAGNIGNYDPSVQSDAMESVYRSGNNKAIEAGLNSIANGGNNNNVNGTTLTSASQTVVRENAYIAIAETVLKDALDNNPSMKVFGDTYSAKEFSQLSQSEKRQYIADYFKKLPIEQKIKLLSSIKNNSIRKTIYTMIARSDSHLFNEICKDKNRADQLLGMGLPNDVNVKINGVVSFLAVSDVGFQNIAKKYDIEYDGSKKYTTTPFSSDNESFQPFMQQDKLGRKFLKL